MTLGVFFSFAPHILALVWAAGLWQGALFVALAILLLRLMPRASATLRHTALLGLFVLTMGMPWLSLLHPTEPAYASHSLHISMWVAIAIAGVWAAATLYRTISLMIAWQYLREVRRNALPVTFDLEASDLGISRRPLVRTSAFVDTPVIVGFFRPVLLLPEWLAPTLSAEEFRQIALHECEHLRRRDDWTNLWLQIGMTLFPLNPALLWLNRRIGVQRELACDAAVVAATARPTEYATSLVNIASQRRREYPAIRPGCLGTPVRDLAARPRLIRAAPKGTRWQRAAATGSAVSSLLASVVGLACAPQFVRIKAPLAVTMASSHNLASIENVSEAIPSHLEPPAVHFVATSYDAPPAANVRPVAKPDGSPARKRRTRQPVITANLRQMEQAFSENVPRVSDAETQDSSVVAVQYEAPVRAVPVLFMPAYLAVPVSGGWIMIQL